jgi:RNA polymerase sigma-70 factor (ECF subfamily)
MPACLKVFSPACNNSVRIRVIRIEQMIRELEFKLLCHRHCDEIYRYARSLTGNTQDAEDATQEVLLRLWRSLPNARLFNARAWLLRTTRNYCLDQIRKRSYSSAPIRADAEILNEHPDECAADPGVAADHHSVRQHISAALQELPETLRSVFVLYEVNGLRYREIAETLDIPINSVKVYLLRARKKLQQRLNRQRTWMTACKS